MQTRCFQAYMDVTLKSVSRGYSVKIVKELSVILKSQVRLRLTVCFPHVLTASTKGLAYSIACGAIAWLATVVLHYHYNDHRPVQCENCEAIAAMC